MATHIHLPRRYTIYPHENSWFGTEWVVFDRKENKDVKSYSIMPFRRARATLRATELNLKWEHEL